MSGRTRARMIAGLAVLLALGLFALVSPAMAHPGPHDEIETIPGMLSHVVASPDHASWLILAATAALSIVAIKAAIRIAATPSKTDEKR